MTGFGRARVSRDGQYVALRVKTVNNRHLDVDVSISSDPDLEQEVKDHVKQYISRGNVSVRIDSNALNRETETVEVDHDLVRDYLTVMDGLIEGNETLDDDVEVVDLLTLPGVLSLKEQPGVDDTAQSMLLEALDEALGDVVEMREAEGEELREDLGNRIHSIQEALENIEDRFPEALESYRERLRERFEEILSMAEPELTEEVENEITKYADKCDISEEIVRMKSHVNQFLDYLDQNEAVGQNLKFLLQEMQREVNTIGAKGNDAEISQLAVEIKTELEKCREQVNNVE
jgi:uncharacterized protein (TIGR00255 family)